MFLLFIIFCKGKPKEKGGEVPVNSKKRICNIFHFLYISSHLHSLQSVKRLTEVKVPYLDTEIYINKLTPYKIIYS